MAIHACIKKSSTKCSLKSSWWIQLRNTHFFVLECKKKKNNIPIKKFSKKYFVTQKTFWFSVFSESVACFINFKWAFLQFCSHAFIYQYMRFILLFIVIINSHGFCDIHQLPHHHQQTQTLFMSETKSGLKEPQKLQRYRSFRWTTKKQNIWREQQNNEINFISNSLRRDPQWR